MDYISETNGDVLKNIINNHEQMSDNNGHLNNGRIPNDNDPFNLNADDRSRVVLNADFLPANFRTQSYEIAKDVCRFISRGEDAPTSPSKVCSIMRSLVDDAIRDKPDTMRHLVQALNVQTREQINLITNVAEQVFDDEQVNWGRIVTLHAFCAFLTKYCEANHIPDCADDIGKTLADFVVNRLGLWIVTHGGWKAFEKQFPAVCIWNGSGVWKGIVVIGLFCGILFAFYTSVRFMSG